MQRIGPSGWALQNDMIRGATPQVGLDICPGRDLGSALILFKRPLLFGAINSTKVIDAGVLWTGSLVTDQIRHQ